ncbi:MAG TPA: hypothetical protein VKQ52_03015 [Puia sp.]|nr:hypothetical protein [Puia sp.]
MKKLFNRVFFRAMFGDFGFRNPYRFRQYEYPAYFQYRIGPYETGHTLCFRRQPYLELYKNEIFAKMQEYSGYDVARYLEFHYAAFADKRRFLHFVWYEVTERLKRDYSKKTSYYRCLEVAREWVEKEMRRVDVGVEEEGGGEGPGASEVSGSPGVGPGSAESGGSPVAGPGMAGVGAGSGLSDSGGSPVIGAGLAELIEPSLSEVTRSFAGKISVNNMHHLDRMIQLFVLLQQVEAPESGVAPLFRSFTDIDLAAILRQFDGFRDKKLNTLQKKISDTSADIRLKKNQRVAKMREMMAEFFYGTDIRP